MDDLLSALVSDYPNVGAAIRKPRLSMRDSHALRLALRGVAKSRPQDAQRLKLLTRFLDAPPSRLTHAPSTRERGVVRWNDFDSDTVFWAAGATTRTQTGARGNSPWIFMGIVYSGPVGFLATTVTHKTINSVDATNWGATLQGLDLSIFAPDSLVWTTPAARPAFQSLPYGTIVGGTTPITWIFNNATLAPILATPTVLKWTAAPCDGVGIAALEHPLLYPSSPEYAKTIRKIFGPMSGEAFGVLRDARIISGYDDEEGYDSDDDDSAY